MASRKKKAQKWKEKVEYKICLRDKHARRQLDKTQLAGIAAVYQEQENQIQRLHCPHSQHAVASNLNSFAAS